MTSALFSWCPKAIACMLSASRALLWAKLYFIPSYRLMSHRTSSFFWVSPGISTRGVLYTQKSAFSRRTKVRLRLFGARPCWFIAKFGELQHQRPFFNGRAWKWPDCTFVLLKIRDFWVYNTPWVDIVCATWNAVQCFAFPSVSKPARFIKKIS